MFIYYLTEITSAKFKSNFKNKLFLIKYEIIKLFYKWFIFKINMNINYYNNYLILKIFLKYKPET